MQDEQEVKRILKKAQSCKILVSDVGKSLKKKKMLDRILADQNDEVLLPKYIIYTDASLLGRNEYAFHAVIEQQNRCLYHIPNEFPSIYHSDIAQIMQTSGSTGPPKLVQLSHSCILAGGYLYQQAMNITADDIHFSPLSHNSGGSIEILAFTGSTRVTGEEELFHRNKHLSRYIESMWRDEKCTIGIVNNLFVQNLLDSKDVDENRTKLRELLTMGSPVPKRYSEIIGRYTDNFLIHYGSWEVYSIAICSVNRPEDFDDFLVGKPTHGTEVKVVDEDGSIVPVSVTGDIYVRNLHISSGYFGDPDKTKSCFNDEGWYITGDVGFMRSDGNFVVLGRKRQIFRVSDGLSTKEIYPYVVENSVIDHFDGIADVGIIQHQSNEDDISEIDICIVPEQDSFSSGESILDFVRLKFLQGLSPNCSRLVCLNELPRLVDSDKIDRISLTRQVMKLSTKK